MSLKQSIYAGLEAHLRAQVEGIIAVTRYHEQEQNEDVQVVLLDSSVAIELGEINWQAFATTNRPGQMRGRLAINFYCYNMVEGESLSLAEQPLAEAELSPSLRDWAFEQAVWTALDGLQLPGTGLLDLELLTSTETVRERNLQVKRIATTAIVCDWRSFNLPPNCCN
jgi:hypothetical protein